METLVDTAERKPASRASDVAASIGGFLMGRGTPPPEAVIRAAHLEGYTYVSLPADHPMRPLFRPDYLGALVRHEAMKREIVPLFGA